MRTTLLWAVVLPALHVAAGVAANAANASSGRVDDNWPPRKQKHHKKGKNHKSKLSQEETEAIDQACSVVCASLVRQLPGKVLINNIVGGNSYQNKLSSYWDLQQREVSPSCFVTPSSPREVSTVLLTITGVTPVDVRDAHAQPAQPPTPQKLSDRIWGWLKGGAKNQENKKAVVEDNDQEPQWQDSDVKQAPALCPFAIRSGGHSPIQGWSNIQSGITLDMSLFKQLDVAADGSYVNFGPGNTWADVYSQLDALGLGTSGGRVATVGAGGLVTGGGFSFFQRDKGLVCDNVLEFEVVLTDGSIITANGQQNSDLYRALKGGTGNFGIVTRIKMRAFNFPGGQMWGGTLFHKTDDTTRATLFGYFQELTKSSTDVHVAWIHTWTFVNAVIVKLWASTSNVQYTLPVTNPSVFAPVLDSSVTTLNTAVISNLTAQTNVIAALDPSGSRQLFATLTIKNSAAFMEEFYQLANQVVQTVQNTLLLRWSISFQSLPHSAYSKASDLGGNALGLENETADLIVILLTATWNLSVDDENVHEAARSLFTQAKTLSQQRGVDSRYVYLNYAEKWQDPIAGYGPESVQNLQAIAKKYDPRGVLQTLVPGGFKIPGAGSFWPSRTEEEE